MLRVIYLKIVQKRYCIILLVILALGFFLRVYGIEYGLPNKNHFLSYKSDENIYIRSISEMNISKLDLNPHFFLYGSWHFYEIALSLLFGKLINFIKMPAEKIYFYLHPSELAKVFLLGRLLSVFFSIATIILVYIIAKRFLKDKKIAILGSFILAIMPAHIFNSHFLKADASITFWATLVLFFSFCILNSGKLRYYILAGIACGFAAGSQYNGVLFFPAIFFAHFLKKYSMSYQRTFLQLFFDKRLIFAFSFALLFFFISSPYIILSFPEFKDAITLMKTRGLITCVEPRTTFFLSTFKIFSVGMTLPFAILGFMSIIFIIFRKRKEEILLFLWLLPYTVAILVTGILAPRFQMVILPGISICIAIFLIWIINLLKRKELILTNMFVLIILSSVSMYAILYAFAYDKSLLKPIQDVASDWVIQNIPKGTKIGIVENPSFERMPSIIHQDYYYKDKTFWSPRFTIINFYNDISLFIKESPEYFIINERQGFPGELKGTFGFQASEFSTVLLDRYYIVKHFIKYPRIFNIEFKPYPVKLSDWSEVYCSIIYVLKIKR